MDWIQFLEDHDIPYVTRGPNTKKGEVSIQCPWCGDDDPSQHMGVSLTKEVWGCYRNVTHRGRAPVRLISALTGLPNSAAKGLARAYGAPSPETLAAPLPIQTPASEAPRANGFEVFSYPSDLRAIKRTGSTAKFWYYLLRRGFDDVDDLVRRYQLQCSLVGQWHDRIVIPLFVNQKLLGWTARAIQPTVHAPRYLSSSEAVKKTVFNEDELREGGKCLFITEGPFDALKLDYYGEPYRVRATCGFGTGLSIDQLSILNSLKRRFKKVVVLFDQGASEAAFIVMDWLQGPNVVLGSLPEGKKDPGELRREEVEQLMRGYL